MATLPARQQQSTEIEPIKQKIADLLADGVPVGKIAKRLGKDDPKAVRQWRHKIRRWVYTDDAFAQALARASKGEAAVQLVGAVEAVGRRAKRGRVDAFKVLGEFSGMHNPKVNHEHSGEVKITLATMPRPEPVKTEDSVDSDAIQEAEIVDD